MATDAFKEKMAQLNAEYRGALPGKFADIDALWAKRADAGALADLHRLLHTMAGSAKVFGFAALGAAAREVEDVLTPLVKGGGGAPDAKDLSRIERLFEVLRQSAR
jgi:HPt (histidine-containing phosphotransfer) domain-containing protein